MSKILIEFEVENPLLISVNDQYMHPVKKSNRTGRYYSYFAPTPYLKEVKSFYEEVLKNKITDDDILSLNNLITGNKSLGLSLDIVIGLPLTEVRNHDISNFIKALEDCIVNRIKIDDSRNYKVSIEERLYESEDNSWIIKITISPYELKLYENLEEI